MPSDAYREIVDRLRRGVEECPAELLDPLAARMADYARTARFEEAADVRDRHRSLARALTDRRNWDVLRHAGLLWAEDLNGESILVEHGRLIASWTQDDQPPLSTTTATDPSPHHVPDSVASAEEARLVWKWLNRPEVRIVESTNPLATPLHPVSSLTSLAVG